MDNIILYSKLATLPDDLKAEVSDFVDFLAAKRKKLQNRKKPTFGSGKGMFVIKPDFDEPLEDFNEYMH
ncbi:hypothetical protein GCM10027341_54520 [Spirosoma knui]